MYNTSATPDQIKKIATAGAQFSKQLRHVWTDEQISTTVREIDFAGVINDLFALEQLDLVDYGRIDRIFYQGAPDQYTWDETRWTKEIVKKLA